MRIGILGSGQVGRTLGAGFASKGHDVRIGTRSPKKPALQKWLRGATGTVSLGTYADAAAHGELLVLACPGAAAMDVIEAAGPERFDGKILLDVSNPLAFDDGQPPGLFARVTDSLGERVQRRLPNTKVVKGLNTMNASTMIRPKMRQGLADVLLCGNNKAAKRKVAGLIRDFGWATLIDVGGIESARWMEAWVPLWVRIADELGSWKVALHILRE